MKPPHNKAQDYRGIRLAWFSGPIASAVELSNDKADFSVLEQFTREKCLGRGA